MSGLKPLYNRIPEPYREEFFSKRAALMRSRVGFFCVLAVGIYFLSTFMSSILYPRHIKHAEVALWAVLLAGAIAILLVNAGARTLKAAKANAYLFTVLLLAILTSLLVIYDRAVLFSAALYLFLLLLVSFTIPWYHLDIIAITFMHMSAYSILFLAMNSRAPEHLAARPYWFIDGVIFILLGFILSIAVRRQEAVRDIENFLLLKEVEKASGQMNSELELATRIHKTLVPTSLSADKVDIAVTYLPILYMGGDYAGYHFLDADKLLFIICDVTGHGVSAALIVNRLHAEFERLAREDREPGELLNRLNDFLIRDLEGLNMYLSAFSGMLDFGKREFLYSNHGHPAQYLYRAETADIEELSSQTNPLGISAKSETIFQHSLRFGGRDRIFLFTDGLIETRDANGEEFGSRSLERFVRENAALSVNVFHEKILKKLKSFGREKFDDDIFLMTIQVK